MMQGISDRTAVIGLCEGWPHEATPTKSDSLIPGTKGTVVADLCLKGVCWSSILLHYTIVQETLM